jgi:hypothetical protein
MTFIVTLFSSKAGSVDATGTWRVTAETPDQAIVAAKLRASPRIWLPNSAWMLVPVPVDNGKRNRQARKRVES